MRAALPEPARADPLAGQPASLIARQEDRDVSDVARLANGDERSSGDDLFFEVAADHADGVGPFGFNTAGGDGVDADLAAGVARASWVARRLPRTAAGLDYWAVSDIEPADLNSFAKLLAERAKDAG